MRHGRITILVGRVMVISGAMGGCITQAISIGVNPIRDTTSSVPTMDGSTYHIVSSTIYPAHR